MSMNIYQIYQANPITTNASTDLMYFGQSPYGAGDDAAMTFANFNAQIVATGTINAIGYYAAAGNKISPISTASNGVLITNNSGVPSYLANSGTPGFVLTANSGAPPSWQAVSASGAITTIQGNSGTATPVSGTVSITGGATGLLTSGSGSTLSLTGTLVVANGGTGQSTLTAYTLLAGGTTATGALQQVSAGSAGQLLQSNGASALPSWTTATFPSGSGTLNHMLRSDGTNWVQTTATTLDASDNFAGITSAAIGNLSLSANTIASTNTDGVIAAIPNGNGQVHFGSVTGVTGMGAGFFDVTIAKNSSRTFLNICKNSSSASSGALAFYTSRNTTVGSFTTVNNGDQLGQFQVNADDGTSFVTCGVIDVVCASAPSTGIIPTNMRFYTQNTSGSNVLGMSLSSAQVLTLANALPVGSGGLGITSTPTNGQIPIGNGTTYSAATLTEGAGITITNGAGSITIAADAGGLEWAGVAGTSQAAAVDSGYVIQNAGATTVTLPATADLGSTVAIQGLGAGGWVMTANTGQTIQVGSAATSSGGTVTSANQWDSIVVVCVVANTTWAMQSSVTAGFVIA